MTLAVGISGSFLVGAGAYGGGISVVEFEHPVVASVLVVFSAASNETYKRSVLLLFSMDAGFAGWNLEKSSLNWCTGFSAVDGVAGVGL